MSHPDEVPTLDPNTWYAECPDCPEDDSGFCLTCWDQRYIAHDHLIDAEVTVGGMA